MKRKNLLFTLLLALMVPLAANAYVERTVTVYNGIAKNSHVPIEGWNHTPDPRFSCTFCVDGHELNPVYEKHITKMTFYVASPGVYTITNNNRYTVELYDPAFDYYFTPVAHDLLLRIDEYGAMEVSLNWYQYKYHGGDHLYVRISSQMSYPTAYPDHLPQFYGVNLPGNGFKPKITFTYIDEATWSNTNRPQGLRLTVGDDGTSLGLSWDAVEAPGVTYQVCCMPRDNYPDIAYNSSLWVTSQNTLSHTFTGLTPNTDYDLYVRARSQTSASAYAKAMCTTKCIANLDEGDLELDFDDGYVSNGVTCTGNTNYMLDVVGIYNSSYTGTYSNYFLKYEGTAPATVNLPQITFSGASNGVIMEFDLWSTENLQVKLMRQGIETDLGTFSVSEGKVHYTVRATESHANQNHNAYFQLVSTGAFSIDNIVIYKPAATMKPYNIQASNITTNSATITWDDDNTGNVTYYMRYRKLGAENWSTNQSAITQNEYELTGLDTYCQYEVQVMAYRSSNDHSDYTESFVFATACPATQTTYTQQFTNLSDLPQYWRVVTGEGNVYSVDNGKLSVSNTSYFATYGSTLGYYEFYMFDAYVILPYFANLATLQLGFDAGCDQGSCNELTVGVMSDPFDTYTFRTVETLAVNEGTNTYDVSLANAAYQHGYIALKMYKYSNGYMSVWLDDFTVTRAPKPTDLTVSNVTNTSATFSWTTSASSVELQYRQAGGTWTTVTPDANPYTLTGLTNSTEYEVQVRADYGTQYSEWASFDNIRTLMQAAVVVDPSHPYSEDFSFINISPGWMYLNGESSSNSCCAWTHGQPSGYGEGRYMYISDDDGTTNHYTVGNSSNFGYIPFNECTVFAAKTFSLNAGIYTFSYKHRVKGISESDYARVALVPANTPLEGIYGGCPNGFSYNTLPEGWIALDGGTELPQYDVVSWTTKTVNYSLYTPGEYMLVFIWHQDLGGTHHSAVQKPIAIDDIQISCTTLIDPPTNISAVESDTQADLAWTAPSSGFTPTGYQVQYEPLGNNGFEGTPIVDANTNAVTLTGLMAHTNYQVRVRSAYSAGGNTIYSDWTTSVAFTTLYPRPTNLTLVEQTSSWASMMWDAVEVDLEEGQYIGYSYQLTTDPDNWGTAHDGVAGNVWSLTLAPGTYYFRVQTVVRGSNNTAFRSPWSEPITFTIAPWTNAVTAFPLTYDFEGSRFDDGITVGGNVDDMGISMYYNSEVSPRDGSENEKMLRFNSGANRQAYLVLPPLHPSTGNALVSFWWYHHSGHQNFQNTNINDGVEVETSTDGQSWSTASYGMITRYDADYSGWKKYEFVFTASANPTYIRLHFRGTPGSWLYCYLDDLTVNAFESQQPYISYVGCDDDTATITLYDYAFENGYYSSAFEVQYREYREPGQTEESWNTCPLFDDEEPAFEHELIVSGLQPTTLYEFRARARVSSNGFDFPWSNYCEVYRQWTDCGVFAVRPGQSYKEDFEYSNRFDCWSGDKASTKWHICDEGHSSDHCLYLDATGSSYQYSRTVKSPEITFSGCDNVILRFWTKCSFGNPSDINNNYVWVYYKSGSTSVNYQIYTIPETNEWQQVELSLSQNALGSSVSEFKIGFNHNYGRNAWYIDDIEIIANAYDKIFDRGRIGYSGDWNNNSTTYWFPHQLPQSGESVMIMGNARILATDVNVGSIQFGSYGKIELAYNQALSTNDGVGELNASSVNLQPQWQTNAYIDIQPGAELNVSTLNTGKAKSLRISGVANITTLNADAANSVVVKDGGVLYAATINGTSSADNNKVVVEDGGQLKTDHEAFATIKKNIDSYTEVEQQNNVERGGYYLISSPLHSDYINPAQGGMVTYVEEDGEVVWNYDLYAFNYEYEGAEWRNYKDDDFLMEVGRGYLYANRDGVELSFAGRIAANDTPVYIGTSYSQGGTYDFNGWKLVGNPFTCDAYITDVSAPDCMSFYRMNPTGSGFIAATGAIKPMEGVFLRSTMSAQAFGFSRDDNSNAGSKLCFNLNQGNVLVDNAIVRFGEGGTLAKFSFNNNTSKVYFPQKSNNYAVVSSHPVGELPLNFEAAKDGTYTLSVSIDEAELLYCHLIDNKTGADVNLLETPEYTFSAKVDDYASRFKVVFVAASEDADGDSETFAFNSNGNWIIANEGRATLQVIDLNGRVLSSQQIEGSAETRINAVPGLYMIRLINGENVKVQKVVVR